MGFGQKSQPTVSPQITSVSATNPLGDRFTGRLVDNRQVFRTTLSDQTQRAVDTSRQASQVLLEELSRPPAGRANDIRQLADRQFLSQEKAITRNANRLLGNARLRLSSRFGRSGNSTFGTQLLNSLANSQLERLGEARLESDLLAEDLFSRDETSRINRLGVFQNVLNDVRNEARRFQTAAANTLDGDANRVTGAALSRARLIQQAQTSQQRQQDSDNRLAFGALSNLLESSDNSQNRTQAINSLASTATLFF